MTFSGVEDSVEEAGGWSQIVLVGVVTVTVLSLTSFAIGNVFRRRRLPPGPRGLPIFGSMLALGPLPHQSLHKLAKQYGPIMFMYLGSVPTLVVSNSKMAEVVLKKKDQIMASRPELIAAQRMFNHALGTGFAPYGPYWRYLRKLATLELFTASRINQFQAMRKREVLMLLHSILETSRQGNAVIIYELLSNLTTNNITQMMFKKSYCFAKGFSTSNDDEAATFREMIKELFDLFAGTNLSDYISILKPFDLQGFNKRIDAMHDKMGTFLETVLEDHGVQSSTGKQANSSQDFADVLLANQCVKKSEAEEGLSRNGIKSILTEMIVAGTDTAATTMEWALTELMRHPSMLKRAQDELDSVVGTNRLVEEGDLAELKFLGTVIKETFRLHPPGPLMVPHESIEDCEISEYHIPAGTRLLVNVWSLQRDPLLYERPLEFDPDRFLDSKMDVKGQDFGLLPFGSGRRICPGMNLGLLMVQYGLATMLHTFSWTLPQDQKPEELDMSESFAMVCPKAIRLGVSVKPRLPMNVIYPQDPL